MAMIRCEMCEKFFDGDWVEMFENPEDPCSMVCIDCIVEWAEDLVAARALMDEQEVSDGE